VRLYVVENGPVLTKPTERELDEVAGELQNSEVRLRCAKKSVHRRNTLKECGNRSSFWTQRLLDVVVYCHICGVAVPRV